VFSPSISHFKRVAKLNHPNQQALAQVFIELIKQTFRMHRQWRETQEHDPYDRWAEAFKQSVAEALKQWWPKAGYAAGLLLRP
jgi:transposase